MHIYTRGNRILAYAPLRKINHIPTEEPKCYHMRRLSRQDVDAMASLSAVIYGALAKGQECFIHKHDRAYYEQMMNNPKMHFVGAFNGRQLIAMSYVRIVNSRKELFEEFPSSNISFLGRDFQAACLGADSVHPDYRGNSINANMIHFRLKYAGHLGVKDCLSIIDRENIWNMRPYFANDFVMMGADVDPSDGGNIALMHRRLGAKAAYNKDNYVEVPFDHFGLLNKMFAYRRVAVGYNSQTRSLRMVCCDAYQPQQQMTAGIFRGKSADAR